MLGLLAAFETVSTHRLLDRLIRSRAWIGLIAFALIGIVALQLGLLKLNSGIGRSLEREALLQRDNASLSIENSELAGGDRVEEQAKRIGMALVPEGALRFLAAHRHSDMAHAVSALQTPVHPEAEAAEGSSTAESEAESASAPAGSEGGAESSEGRSEPEAGSAPEPESGHEATQTATPTSETEATSAPSGETASTGGGTQAAP